MPITLRSVRSIVATLSAAAMLSGCATTDLPQLRSRSSFQPEAGEQKMWDDAAKLDRALEDKKVVYEDEALQAHLDSVVARLLPQFEAQDMPVRVRVLRDPYLNAFALPNGSLYLHSGLLAQMDNEAQLATVMGHELTHYLERHALETQNAAENRRSVTLAVFAVLAVAAVAASGDANAARAMLELGEALSPVVVDAQMSGYSRDLEREADRRSFEAVVAAGYDARETPKVFAALQADTREAGIEEPYFFGSHPRLAERIENFDELAAEHVPAAGVVPIVGQEEFAAAVSDMLLENARADINMGRTARACRAIERHLAHRPQSSAAVFLLGEARRRAGETDAAMAAYERSTTIDPDAAAAFLEIGLLHRAAGRNAEANHAFARYLTLVPSAADRPIIEAYMSETGNPAERP